MDYKSELETTKKMLLVGESLFDYAGPLFVLGNIDMLMSGYNPTIISATMPREEFVILNNCIPNWVNEVNAKANDSNNILIIKDMDKISVQRQEILLDILEDNQVSTENLPENLKIILNADKKCDISFKIRDLVEYYEI